MKSLFIVAAAGLLAVGCSEELDAPGQTDTVTETTAAPTSSSTTAPPTTDAAEPTVTTTEPAPFAPPSSKEVTNATPGAVLDDGTWFLQASDQWVGFEATGDLIHRFTAGEATYLQADGATGDNDEIIISRPRSVRFPTQNGPIPQDLSEWIDTHPNVELVAESSLATAEGDVPVYDIRITEADTGYSNNFFFTDIDGNDLDHEAGSIVRIINLRSVHPWVMIFVHGSEKTHTILDPIAEQLALSVTMPGLD